MYTYQMDYTVSRVNDTNQAKLSKVMQEAIAELVSRFELYEYSKDERILDNWANDIGAGEVYIVLESTAQPVAVEHHNFNIYLLLQSKKKLKLSQHFTQVARFDPSNYNQIRELAVDDATSDYSSAVDEWNVPKDGIVILRYRLVKGDRGYPPHFAANIFLCAGNKRVQPTSIFDN